MTVADTWEQVKYKSYIFPVKEPTDKFNIERVHPRMQKGAIEISDSVRNDRRVISIVLFGSSTNIRCNHKSDYDLLVRLEEGRSTLKDKEEISEKIQDACDWKADILWYDKLDFHSQLYKHILKGVQIL